MYKLPINRKAAITGNILNHGGAPSRWPRPPHHHVARPARVILARGCAEYWQSQSRVHEICGSNSPDGEMCVPKPFKCCSLFVRQRRGGRKDPGSSLSNPNYASRCPPGPPKKGQGGPKMAQDEPKMGLKRAEGQRQNPAR